MELAVAETRIFCKNAQQCPKSWTEWTTVKNNNNRFLPRYLTFGKGIVLVSDGRKGESFDARINLHLLFVPTSKPALATLCFLNAGSGVLGPSMGRNGTMAPTNLWNAQQVNLAICSPRFEPNKHCCQKTHFTPCHFTVSPSLLHPNKARLPHHHAPTCIGNKKHN